MSDLAWRTRIFARLLALAEPAEGIDVAGLPDKRARRLKLQASAAGRFVFGSIDRGVDVTEIELAGRRTLVYRGGGVLPRPVVVNFHGGGWVQGNPEQSQWMSSRIAAQCGAVVIAPSYRLAPEDPYPAAVDDAWDTVQAVIDQAEALGVDPHRMAVMGDSAGGNLAAVVAQRSRREDVELRAQVLIYPGTEMYDRFPSEDEHAEAPVLTSVGMRQFARLYLGEAYGTEDAAASPLRAADLSGLAKTLILVAGVDPLRDNGARYRDRLADAGVPVRYREYAEAIHGFMSLPGVVPVARQGLDDVIGFLGETL